MTNEAKQTLSYLRDVARGCAEEGIKLTSSALVGIADTLEAELRRCRADTLREAAGMVNNMARDLEKRCETERTTLPCERGIAIRSVFYKLSRMADEAEREADHDS